MNHATCPIVHALCFMLYALCLMHALMTSFPFNLRPGNKDVFELRGYRIQRLNTLLGNKFV